VSWSGAPVLPMIVEVGALWRMVFFFGLSGFGMEIGRLLTMYMGDDEMVVYR
jgi:hypothetical protein